MSNLLILVTAMVLSMAIVPLMIRIAPRVGMIDMPDPRKVHTMPIARVGGIGIVIGALIPIVLWLPFDPLIISYLFGSLVLLVFGVWDDSCELGHYVKFVGQFLAVIPVVYYADIYVSALPVLGDIPVAVGKVFTVIALVGMINAINHSDGLDGLAGGMSMLSLASLGYMMYMAKDTEMLFVVLSVMGGVFGFLRYNSHPAKVFMGDGGSQFLGFTVGFLAVVLVEKSNPALSPALPLLILGLPIVDILAVFYLRITGGMNWFKATRNHIHHRLLDLGFTHYEAVIIIYLIQMTLVISSIFLMYEYDWLIIFFYLAITSSVFVVLTILEHRGFQVGRTGSAFIDELINNRLKNKVVIKVLGRFIVLSIPVIFLVVGVLVDSVPMDLGYLSLLLFSCILIAFIFLKKYLHLVTKLVLYVTAALVVYLDYLYLDHGSSLLANFEITLYVLLAISIVLIIRFDERGDFEMSPMDYLVAIIVLIAFVAINMSPEEIDYGPAILKLILLFYGCELVDRRNVFGFKFVVMAGMATLLSIAWHALI